MKKIKTMMAMMLAVVGMCVTFSACSDDGDEKIAPAADYVAGSYISNLDITVMGQTTTYENVEAKVEKVDANTINVMLPAAGEGAMALPALPVNTIKVSGSDGTYTFAVEAYKGTVVVNDATKEYTVTLQGTFANNQLTLNYQLQYGNMPMAMIGRFVATK